MLRHLRKRSRPRGHALSELNSKAHANFYFDAGDKKKDPYLKASARGRLQAEMKPYTAPAEALIADWTAKLEPHAKKAIAAVRAEKHTMQSTTTKKEVRGAEMIGMIGDREANGKMESFYQDTGQDTMELMKPPLGKMPEGDETFDKDQGWIRRQRASALSVDIGPLFPVESEQHDRTRASVGRFDKELASTKTPFVMDGPPTGMTWWHCE